LYCGFIFCVNCSKLYFFLNLINKNISIYNFC
jgi:hypothetical protein